LTTPVPLCYDELVKYFLSVFALLFLALLPVAKVHASSLQAYQDYLYQYDIYRQKYTEFQVAKNSYDKFKTLESQTQALSATKFMLSQRDLLLRTYMLYLFERTADQNGLTPENKQLYQSLLSTELAFLETQSNLVSSINSIDDALKISQQLESHYKILLATIREITIGISLGQLNAITDNFDHQVIVAQTLVTQNSSFFNSDKKSTINSWFTQIQNKRTLFSQKIDDITQLTAKLATISDSSNLDQKSTDIFRQIGEAKQYMADSIANLGEISVAMQYAD
jgi:hypothetical protein